MTNSEYNELLITELAGCEDLPEYGISVPDEKSLAELLKEKAWILVDLLKHKLYWKDKLVVALHITQLDSEYYYGIVKLEDGRQEPILSPVRIPGRYPSYTERMGENFAIIPGIDVPDDQFSLG